jgi:DNA-binding transcriptional ArsR family regulator
MVNLVAEISESQLEELTALFRLLSEKTRLAILVQLTPGEKNVSELCEKLGLPQPTVSHHLGLLRMHNIVANRRNGKQVYYELKSPPGEEGHMLEFVLDTLKVNVTRNRQTA